MKKLVVLSLVTLLFSCKNDSEKKVEGIVDEVKNSTEVVAKEGSGKAVLVCNGKEIVSEGVCGALVTMGDLIVAVKDKTNPAKVFMISFNGEDFPKEGVIYKIKSKDYTKEGIGPKDEVSVSFSEGLPNNKMNSWGSDKATGSLQFTYNGNEVKCVFKDLTLSSAEMFNADDLKADGKVSGELSFYKN